MPSATSPDSSRRVWNYPNVAGLSLGAFFNDTGADMLFAFQAVFILALLGDDPAAMSKLGLVKSISLVAGLILLPTVGRVADRSNRKPLIVEGYVLIVIARAVQGLAWMWWHLIPLRFLNELGRALRNPARESLLADSVPAGVRGRAFGIFKSMDTFGAIVGPLAGLGVYFFLTAREMAPLDVFRWIFVVSACPTLISIAVIVAMIREVRGTLDDTSGRSAPPAAPPPASGRRKLSLEVLRSVPHLGMLTFLCAVAALWSVEENFLITCGVKLLGIPLSAVWPAVILYWLINVTFAPTAYFAGRWSDRRHRRGPIVAGYLLLSALCFGFAFFPPATPVGGGAFRLEFRSFAWVGLLFAMHGVHQGLIGPTLKAFVIDLAPVDRRAEAIGAFDMCTGLAAVVSPVLFGVIWDLWGAPTAFGISGVCVGLSALSLRMRIPVRGEAS